MQHPSESKKPMGTAKILQLSLSGCELWVGEDFSQHPELNDLLQDEKFESLVLYPNEHSQSLERVKESRLALNSHGKSLCLILLDGTWKKAYKMWQLSSNLHSLPSVALPSHIQGNYRIRKAPTEQHLSTVEAGFHALSAVESHVDFSPLLTAFTNMVDYQISQMPEGVFARNYKS